MLFIFRGRAVKSETKQVRMKKHREFIRAPCDAGLQDRVLLVLNT